MKYLILIATLIVLTAVKIEAQQLIWGARIGSLPSSVCPAGITCYFFAQTGSDTSGLGTLQQPWQTVAKAQTTLAAGVSPDTRLLFNGGDTWHEMFTLGTAVEGGTSGHPAIIGSWGTGQPLFDEQNLNPFCFKAENPPFGVSNLTIDNIACTRAWHKGTSFKTSKATDFQGITWSNNLVYDTGAGCGHKSNIACVGVDGYPDWSANTAHKSPSSCSNSDPSTVSCGYMKPCLRAGSPPSCSINGGSYIFQELVASCASSATVPTNTQFPQTAGSTGALDGTCQWKNTGITTGYLNQANFEDDQGWPHSFHIIGNTVKWSGGHNPVEVHYDSGKPLIQGNFVGPGIPHNGIDVKVIGNWAAGGSTQTVVGSLPGNVAQFVNNVVRCGYSLGICGVMNGVNSGAASYFFEQTGPASPGSGNNTPDVLYAGNVGWDIGNTGVSGANAECFYALLNASGCPSTSSCPLVARYYHNTCYGQNGSPGRTVDGIVWGLGAAGNGTYGQSTVDIQNNIIDGFASNTILVPAGPVASNAAAGSISTEGHNNLGGSQGSTGAFTFRGSATKGTGDVININPTYVSAATGDFRLLLGSPMLSKGIDVGDGNPNIGFYAGIGQ